MYSAVLNQKPVPLKTRLGAILPPGGVEPPTIEDEQRVKDEQQDSQR
jgi:hypothetical protein